ncbi:MAG: hypothetical protein ACI8RD_000407 [Bacillariaceae sp.]|jgi:hypothetical protein
MAPHSTHYDNNYDDGYNISSAHKTNLGFTAPLIDSISTFKAKFQNWAECEKSKADLRAESYRSSLVQEQAVIDSRLTELIDIQREMGTNEKNDNSNTVEGKEDIASRKNILEEKSAKVQIEILKLKTERDNRNKRIQDIALEESKQRIRANDASSLKRMAEESKKTTIDDLTRGIVSYKKLGLDFTQTGRDAGLE